MPRAQRVWKFGLIYSVTLSEDPRDWDLYDYLPRMPAIDAMLNGRSIEVVGEVGRRMPLIRLSDAPTIFALCEMQTYSLLPVAASLATLQTFLDDAAAVWAGFEDQTSLPATTGNRELASMVLDEFALANPGIDTQFWEDEFFMSLTFAFPLA